MKMLMQRKTLADAGIELKQISAIGKGCHTEEKVMGFLHYGRPHADVGCPVGHVVWRHVFGGLGVVAVRCHQLRCHQAGHKLITSLGIEIAHRLISQAHGRLCHDDVRNPNAKLLPTMQSNRAGGAWRLVCLHPLTKQN